MAMVPEYCVVFKRCAASAEMSLALPGDLSNSPTGVVHKWRSRPAAGDVSQPRT